MDKIVDELNQALEAEIMYLKHVHKFLSAMSYYNYGAVETAIEGLYGDFEFETLCENKWGFNILSPETINTLKIFKVTWNIYRKQNTFSDNGVFIYFDPVWNQLIKNYLIPAIEYIEEDFKVKDIAFTSYRNDFNSDLTPSAKDFLWVADNLFSLLLRNNLIKKIYLDET